MRRIDAVRDLRELQFPEDAGPMAHPVRPDSYVAIDNFYTATVYEKGAEVVRMMAALVGRDGFRRGMDLYFARHDGQAVTFYSVAGITLTVTLYWLTQGAVWAGLGATGWGTVAALAVLMAMSEGFASALRSIVRKAVGGTPKRNRKALANFSSDIRSSSSARLSSAVRLSTLLSRTV